MSDIDQRREGLALDTPGTVLLDSVPREGFTDRSLLFRNPESIITCVDAGDLPRALAEIDDAVNRGRYVAGMATYEAGAALQGIPFQPAKLPLIWFGVYPDVIKLARDETDGLLPDSSDASVAGTFALGPGEYTERIQRVKSHIREGDVYQINFTAPYRFDFEHEPLELYAAMRRRQRVSYAAFINTGEHHVLSVSPELFFARNGKYITARPMKGTAPRGHDDAADKRISETLRNDAKNRAENLMIVDLIRNDLSRLCRPGSVKVPSLFEAEIYDTVIQMTSTVEGELRTETRYTEIFRSLFPSGSITGAPKLRAMEIIADLEAEPRGVYCGSVGFIAPDDTAVFNVAIRTVELSKSHGQMGIGSGIVWDSVPELEYDECLLKAKFLSGGVEPGEKLELIETMLYDGEIRMLDLHLDRLGSSAACFMFPFEREYVRSEIESYIEELVSRAKIRLALDRSGRVRIATGPVDEFPSPASVVVSPHRITADDVFRRHKTSRRDMYDREFERARSAGFDEVIFCNERGEVAEGSRSNLLAEIGGVLFTPPVSSGALPGVFRKHMLESRSDTQEKILTLTDLSDSNQLYICNAVRGLCDAELVADENFSRRRPA